MSIIRNKLKSDFSQIPNNLITDNRLSHSAKLVMLYLLSKHDGWVVNNSDVQRQLNIKRRETIAKYWKELINTGWIFREFIPHRSGRFDFFEYTLHNDLQIDTSPCTKEPYTEDDPVDNSEDDPVDNFPPCTKEPYTVTVYGKTVHLIRLKCTSNNTNLRTSIIESSVDNSDTGESILEGILDLDRVCSKCKQPKSYHINDNPSEAQQRQGYYKNWYWCKTCKPRLYKEDGEWIEGHDPHKAPLNPPSTHKPDTVAASVPQPQVIKKRITPEELAAIKAKYGRVVREPDETCSHLDINIAPVKKLLD
jgi:hypothetical protein